MSSRTSPFVATILTPLLVFSPVWAQAPAPITSSSSESANQSLQVHVIASDGPLIQMNFHSQTGFTVRVTTSDGTPVSDAAVAFRLPDGGPTGTFKDGTHSAVAYTDGSGTAHVADIQWNETPGPFAVRVTATKGTTHAGMLIEGTLSSTAELASKPASVEPFFGPLPTPPPMQAQTPGALVSTTGASGSIQNLPAKPSQDNSIAQVDPAPAVSVTSASPGSTEHSGSMKKWLILAAVVAGAGAGAAMAMHGKGNSSSGTSASGVSIGAPSVSVGAP